MSETLRKQQRFRSAVATATAHARPSYPRFASETVLVPVKDGYLIDGLRQIKLLQGSTAQRMLAPLVKLMDGTRTLEELQAALPAFPRDYVVSAVDLLVECGLVEEGEMGEDAPGTESETLSWLRRFNSVTNLNRNGREAWQRLCQSAVMIVCGRNSLSLADVLQDVLKGNGVGSVASADALHLDLASFAAGPGFGSRLVISLAVGSEDCDFQSRLDDTCLKLGLPWLRVVLMPGIHADIGPFFDPAAPPCYRCFAVTGLAESASVPSADFPPEEACFWMGMAATEITYAITRSCPLITGRNYKRYREGAAEGIDYRALRIPGCTRCCPVVKHREDLPRHERLLDTAFAFEEFAGNQPHSAMAFAGNAERAARSGMAIQTKRLPNSKQVALQRETPRLESGMLELLQPLGAQTGRPVTLEAIGTLLGMTVGIRGRRNTEPKIKRWTATAGNRGSVEIAVIVRDMEDLAPGTYFYQPHEHTLARLEKHSGTLEPCEFIRRSIPAYGEKLPSVLISLTGAFHRLAPKYGIFGHRLTQMDAGVAQSQIHILARALGLGARTEPRWCDDVIAEQLNLEPLHEQATGVVAIGDISALPGPATVKGDDAESFRSHRRHAAEFRGVTSQIALEMIFEESRTTALTVPPPAQVQHKDGAAPVGGPGSPLPAALRGGRLLGEIMAGRASVRQYCGYEISLEQAATMLWNAHQMDAHDWPGEPDLALFVLASRIRGLAPSVYKYDGDKHRLIEIAALPDSGRIGTIFVQPEFASAPAVVWIAGNLQDACSRYGSWGHRMLLLRAGAAGNRMWMSAMGMGLVGCLVAGIVPETARHVFATDGYHQASLLAYATGHGNQPVR